MKTTNTLAAKSANIEITEKPFSVQIRGDALQSLIRKSVRSAADAARLTGTLISAVSANEKLRECAPHSIVAAALRGEGMGLTYGLDYHLVPFGKQCTYITGYKGYLHLLIATGEVADTNCIAVREGEYKGRNKRTKRPEFDFSVYETEDEEENHPVIGYYFYVDLKNGYSASEYMRVGDVVLHAQRYSKSFDIDVYRKLESGQYSPQEAEKLREKSPWYGNFDLMAKKTVIRKLLNSGFVPLANNAQLRRALDDDGESGEGDFIIPDAAIPARVEEVIEVSGEVKEDAAESPVSDQPTPEEAPSQEKKQGRRGRPVKAVEVQPDEDDAISSFFGE